MWGWLGDNAGQIQIVIAILAFILAYVVYRKVLKQIEISQEQALVANKQRGFELKIQSLSLTITALDRNISKINNLQEVLTLSNKSLESLSASSELNEEDIKDLIQTINLKIKDAEDFQNDILDLCECINEQEILSNSDVLQSIYNLLISVVNDHNISSLMKHHFVETEISDKD